MRMALVLLAAGDSRRFGGNKLLYGFEGKPMYRHMADQAAALSGEWFARKLVVTQYPEIMEDMKDRGYEVVENKDSHLGISHSIHLALKALEEEKDETAVCFAVCDQPYLKAETLEELLKGFLKSGKGIGCLCNMGELGNPAVFSSRYWDELLALEGDVGGKRVIRRHIDDLYLYEVEDGLELVDIDLRPDHHSQVSVEQEAEEAAEH